MHGARGWRGAGVLMLALLGCGCTPRPPSPVAPGATVQPVQPVQSMQPMQPASVVMQPVATATSPRQLLPEGTALILQSEGIGALLAVLDLDALVPKVRPFYDPAAAFLTNTLGANLMDPTQWPLIGVDPKGPMGVALVDVRSTTLVLYVTVADSERLRAIVDRLASPQRLVPVFEDRGVVLRTEEARAPALVLRDGFAFLVITDKPEAMTHDVARQLASGDPARGLTASPRYRQALAGGAPGAGLTAYVDLSPFVEQEEQRLSAEISAPEPTWAEQELEAAIGRGAPPDEQDRLRQQVDVERGWRRSNLDRRMRVVELGKRWLAGVSPIVFEFSASLTGLTGTIRAKMPEASPLRAALRNAPEPSPVLMALGERPAVMLGGNVDLPVALAEFEALLRSEGEDPEKMYRWMAEGLRIREPRRELLAVLTGSGAFALTVPEATLRGEGRRRDPGLAVGLGVRDPARAEALLEGFWRGLPGKAGKDRASGAHTLEEPGGTKFYAKVVAQQVVVTTDPGVLQRMASGDPRATLKWLEPSVVPVVSARDVVMQGLLDPVLATLLIRGQSGEPDEQNEGSEPSQPYWWFPDVSKEKLDKVPRSAAYKAQLREWQALNAKIRKRAEVQARSEAQQTIELARCVGTLVGNLREQPDGLLLAGGQMFGKGGLARAIELASGLGARRDEGLDELRMTRAQLSSEMQRVRARDVSRALNVPMPAE